MLQSFRLAAITVTTVALMACATTSAKGPFPDPAGDDPLAAKTETDSIVLAGGCFWGMQEIFDHVHGVTNVVVGYAGGEAKTATYEQVETGRTGHAESARITFDRSQVTLGTVLKVFFAAAHDPTQVNQQLPDVGPQYRSVIFYRNDRQRELAQAYVSQLNVEKTFRRSIATQIVPLDGFYPAEPYHQHYAERNPGNPYIFEVDVPKLENFRKTFPALYVK